MELKNFKLFGRLRNKYHVFEILRIAFILPDVCFLMFSTNRGLRETLLNNINYILSLTMKSDQNIIKFDYEDAYFNVEIPLRHKHSLFDISLKHPQSLIFKMYS